MARINNIKEHMARRQQAAREAAIKEQGVPQKPITQDDAALGVADQVADRSARLAADKKGTELPERITYNQAGIAPTVTSPGAYRREALQSMDEDTFRQNQERMNASDREYWTQQAAAHPESIYANLGSLLTSDETPVEKARRERREQLGQTFANLGNLIGNAANLYYTAKGAYPAELNAPVVQENERMRRIKEKRDALQRQTDLLLANARADDLKAARARAAAQAEAGREAADKAAARRHDLEKLALTLVARKAGDDAKAKDRKRDADERHRHNRVMEALSAQRAKGDGKQETYAVTFQGRDGTKYRYKDKDLAQAVASRLADRIKAIAMQRMNDNTLSEEEKEQEANTIALMDQAYFDSKNPMQVTEFVRQYLSLYPEAEAEMARDPDVVIERQGAQKRKKVEGFGNSDNSNQKKTIPGF